jgi:hypothetical protein
LDAEVLGRGPGLSLFPWLYSIAVVGQNPPASSDRLHEEPRGSQDCWWAPVPRSMAQNLAHNLASGLLGVPPDLVPD